MLIPKKINVGHARPGLNTTTWPNFQEFLVTVRQIIHHACAQGPEGGGGKCAGTDISQYILHMVGYVFMLMATFNIHVLRK